MRGFIPGEDNSPSLSGWLSARDFPICVGMSAGAGIVQVVEVSWMQLCCHCK